MTNVAAFTIKDLAEKFSKLGFMIYIENSKSMIINFHYIDLDTTEFESDSVAFQGDVEEIQDQFDTWYNNKAEWVEKDRVLYLKQWKRSDDFDLTIRLEEMGFSDVVVWNEDSNFPRVEFNYKYGAHGIHSQTHPLLTDYIVFEEIGDKFKLIKHIKEEMSKLAI